MDDGAYLARVDPEVLMRLISGLGLDLRNRASTLQIAPEFYRPEIDNELNELDQNASLDLSGLRKLLSEYWETVDEPSREVMLFAGAIGRYSSGRHMMSFPRSDFKDAVESWVNRIITWHEGSDLRIDATEIRPAHRPRFDDFFLERAFRHLVDDSKRAYGSMEGTYTIWVGTNCCEDGVYPDGDYAELFVADTAPALSEERLRHYLDGTACRRETDGLLYNADFVKDVVAVHGGLFQGESVPGGETTFRIRIQL